MDAQAGLTVLNHRAGPNTSPEGDSRIGARPLNSLLEELPVSQSFDSLQIGHTVSSQGTLCS
jgi:hypothetical protein